MADKNRQAERKNSIPVQALVCLLAIAAPCGLAWAAAPSAGFAPASYIGEYDPNLVWELLLGADRRRFLPGSDRDLDTGGVARGQERTIAAQRIHQLGAQHAQPGRDDNQRAKPRGLLQRPLSRNVRAQPRRDFELHDRPRTGRTAPRTGPAQSSPSTSSASLPAARKASSPNCRTGDRCFRRSSACPMAGRSARMRIARSSASCRANWHRPPNFWNRCSTTFRSASPPRTSRTAAISSSTARSSASRASPATTSSASAPTKSSGPKPRRASRRRTRRR